MMMETAEYLISLIRSVLKQEQPSEKSDSITFQDLYRLAQFHCVEGITYYAIEKLDQQPDTALLKEWRANRDGNIIKSINQMAELERISAVLSRNHIKHLFLKGAVLVKDYPQLDYRYLGDLDILIESSTAHFVKELLTTAGYSNLDFGVSNHDTYRLEKEFYHIDLEVHRQLFDKEIVYEPYFNESVFFNRTDDYRCEMTLEEFYIYMVTHFAKHYFFKGGSGIRSVMDFYVFLEKYENQMDWDVVNHRLQSMDLDEFERQIYNLSATWFKKDVQKNKSLDEMTRIIVTQGAYGTFEHKTDTNLHRSLDNHKYQVVGKITYLWHRIFMEPRFIKKHYPYVKRMPFLLPIGWLHRLIDATLKKRERLLYELKALFSTRFK